MIFFSMLICLNLIGLLYALYHVPKFVGELEIRPLFFLVPFPPFIVGFSIYLTDYYALGYFYVIAGIIFLSFFILASSEPGGAA